MKILLTGGGTGGHVVPLVALIRELRRVVPAKDLKFLYLGPKDEFAKLVLSHEGIATGTVLAGKIRRYGGILPTLENILDMAVKMPIGIMQAFWKIFFFSPDVVFSKGGYGALPITIAARMLGVPVFLHESDAVPGRANVFASHFALKVFTSYPKTPDFKSSKVMHVGNFVRREMLTGSKEEATSIFNLVGDKPVLLVLGGSQGSQRMNDMILASLDDLLSDFEIIHQAGFKNADQVRKEAAVVINPAMEKYFHVVSFMRETDLRHAYAASDLILSRSGAATIFELAALGKPAILVPLPESAQNHQVRNAYRYAQTGAALVLEESNLTPRFFLEKLRYLFSHTEELQKMAAAAKSFARPEAANIAARVLVEYLKTA
ncbi:MAG: UDP-N-acetylglucosamine--N-acetylmuramyl-(pentapeptide) pyrophosphoryl-undecaprenol N-acetylglucosamine transferase [Parcubacteria group bacterium]|nr:UDP-N-acetylglucosamine--N-acetylmuramyl-(pentapeptide) pyrophosphoryl-undecaprenol N-acetylglucosamine transferase [Parcubacteria group bacterium]